MAQEQINITNPQLARLVALALKGCRSIGDELGQQLAEEAVAIAAALQVALKSATEEAPED